nr:beta-propeller fold lactonase family protein [Frigoribacterium sp. CFBP 8766]
MSRPRTFPTPVRSLRTTLAVALAALALIPLTLAGEAPSASAAEVSTTIPVGADPFDLAVSPDGARVLVANFSDETVSVIDTASLAVTATFAVTDRPRQVAFSPDGSTAYVLVGDVAAAIDVVDVTTNTLVTTIPGVGFLPTDLTVTADGRTAWVASFGAGSLSRIDLTTRTVVGSFRLGGRGLTAAVVNPDGSTVYALDSDGTLAFFDTATNLVTRNVAVPGSGPIALTPDSSTLYVSGFDGSDITLVDTATGTTTDTVALTGAPDRVRFSRDGGTAYAAVIGNDNIGRVVAIDTATRRVVDTTTVGQDPAGVGVTPDGALLFVANSSDATVSVIRLPLAPVFTAATPPTIATVGQAYSFTFTATGNPPPTFTVTSGTLPAGLTLTAGGVLSGTPTAAGASTFTVTATNGVAPATTTPPVTVTVAPVIVPAPDRLPAPLITSPADGQTVTGPVTYRGTGTPGAYIALVSFEGDTPPQSSGPIEDAFAAADPIQVAADSTWSRTIAITPGDYTTFAVEFRRDADGTVTLENTSPASEFVSYSVVAATVPVGAAPTAPAEAAPSAGRTPATSSATNLALTGSETSGLVGLGALLVGAGVALTVASRRRRSTAPSTSATTSIN